MNCWVNVIYIIRLIYKKNTYIYIYINLTVIVVNNYITFSFLNCLYVELIKCTGASTCIKFKSHQDKLGKNVQSHVNIHFFFLKGKHGLQILGCTLLWLLCYLFIERIYEAIRVTCSYYSKLNIWLNLIVSLILNRLLPIDSKRLKSSIYEEWILHTTLTDYLRK